MKKIDIFRNNPQPDLFYKIFLSSRQIGKTKMTQDYWDWYKEQGYKVYNMSKDIDKNKNS